MHRNLKVWVIGSRGIPNLQGGIEKHIEKLYLNFRNTNCQITVINRSCYFKEKKLKNWQGIELLYIWAPKSKYFEAAIHTFFSIIFARIKSPDIIHIHAIGPSLFVPLAKILGFKVVVTHHGPDYLRRKWKGIAKIILRLGELFAVKFADKIIVISNYIKNYLEKKYKRKDFIVIPNGVEIPKILPPADTLKKFNLEPKKYIFSVCRFVPEKGLHDLIMAYRKINNPKFKLVIAGDADHETNYSRNLKKLARATPGVILTGVITNNSLQELYSNAGLFVLPSYYEGLPLALLEALSYGIPVLVSNIPQHNEIPLANYRYFSAGFVDELKQKMVELYEKGITDEEKNFILEYLKNYYSWEILAKKVLEIYKTIDK